MTVIAAQGSEIVERLISNANDADNKGFPHDILNEDDERRM